MNLRSLFFEERKLLKSGTRRSESAKNKQVLSRTQSIKVNQSIKVLSRTQSLVILVLALLVVFFGVFFLLISFHSNPSVRFCISKIQ